MKHHVSSIPRVSWVAYGSPELGGRPVWTQVRKEGSSVFHVEAQFHNGLSGAHLSPPLVWELRNS